MRETMFNDEGRIEFDVENEKIQILKWNNRFVLAQLAMAVPRPTAKKSNASRCRRKRAGAL